MSWREEFHAKALRKTQRRKENMGVLASLCLPLRLCVKLFSVVQLDKSHHLSISSAGKIEAFPRGPIVALSRL
jgi:hypothetical protein